MPTDDPPFANLGFAEEAAVYESASQNVRVLSEGWAGLHLYCPNCGAARVRRHPNNTHARDFFCETCAEDYELKAGKGAFTRSVPDGAYGTFMAAVRERRNANLVLMRYDAGRASVTDVMIVPRHFIAPEVVRARKPLASTARRAGWVGCNILVGEIPEAGRVWLLRQRERTPKADVLHAWDRARPFARMRPDARGWTYAVLNAVEGIGRAEFTLDDAYAAEAALSAQFPANNHVRPKIRQQLQVLRDAGLLQFTARGRYRLVG